MSHPASKYNKRSPSAEEVDIDLLFALDGTNTPTLKSPSAWAAQFSSIARNSAGNYTITLRNNFVALKGHALGMRAHSAVDLVPQLGDVDVVDAKTVVVRLLTGAVETDPPAAASNATFLSVRLTMQTSTAAEG